MYIYIILTKTALLTSQQIMFLENYMFLYVLMQSWCQLLEDGENAETCQSRVIVRTHRV